jgi:hypothetical protein
MLKQPPNCPSAGKVYGCSQLEPMHGQSTEERSGLICAVPSRTSIASSPASAPLFQPQQALPVEQADGESAARYAHYLANGLHLLADEAERGDRHHEVEAARSKG